MSKKIVKAFLILMCLLFIIGLVLIFSSTSAGQNAGTQAIQNGGGSMDTWAYQRIIESTTNSYRTGGLVISLVGGFGILLSGYALFKENISVAK